MKGIRHLLRRYLVPTILLGGLVTITVFYFVNQPQFSGDLVNGVLRMDWGDVEKDRYRSIRTDLSRPIWELRIYHQEPSGPVPPVITLKRKNTWNCGFAVIRRANNSAMPLWEIKAPSMVGITALAGIPLLYFLYRSATYWRRVRGRQCLSCGYSTTGWFSDLCPECGKPHYTSRKHFGIRTVSSALVLIILLGGSVWQVFGLGAGNAVPFVADPHANGNFSNRKSFRLLGQSLPPPIPIPIDTYRSCEDLGLTKAELEWIAFGDLDSSVFLIDRMEKYIDVSSIWSGAAAGDPCATWLLGLPQPQFNFAP